MGGGLGVFVALVLLSLLSPSLGGQLGPAKFEVKNLPGQPRTPDFEHYAGHIPVMDSSTKEPKNLFFWLVTAVENPREAPLMVWMNGGPGCSSMMGMLTENGPFRVMGNGSHLEFNEWSWNQNANVLYLDQPSGVGYSYGGNYTTGDNICAEDNLQFMLGFRKEFPVFANSELVISGESFAGNYVPELAFAIFNYNKGPGNTKFNLRGFAVGNPTGVYERGWETSFWVFMKDHGFISTSEYKTIKAACDPSTPACHNAYIKLWNETLWGINPYNIYGNCQGGGPAPMPECFTSAMGMSFAEAHDFLQSESMKGMIPGPMRALSQTFVPCIDTSPSYNYLNLPEVRQALHVPSECQRWTACSSLIRYDQFNNSIPDMYKQMAGKIKILVYSGDVDSCVPWLGTRGGMFNLGFKPTAPAHPWYYMDGEVSPRWPQVGGYAYPFEQNITYVTVRGSGHMVPTFTPAKAYYMIQHYLKDQPF